MKEKTQISRKVNELTDWLFDISHSYDALADNEENAGRIEMYSEMALAVDNLAGEILTALEVFKEDIKVRKL